LDRRTERKDEMSKESWIKSKWRPMMGWAYISICLFDFIIGPIFWTVFQGNFASGLVAQQWTPLTLGSGGLFHMAMGAILGVTAWSRGQEKIRGVAGDGFMSESFESESTYQKQYPTGK
jgi:hypothetical protein